MTDRTAKTLKELESFLWFKNVGQPLEGNYLLLHDWSEAITSSAGETWSSVQLQVKNRFAQEVRQKNYERATAWNRIAAELREGVSTIVAKSIEPIGHGFPLKTDFLGAVSWDMLLICLEVEFSDVISPRFFVPRLKLIYAAGHFPCGWEGPKLEESWEGEVPDWKLFVY